MIALRLWGALALTAACAGAGFSCAHTRYRAWRQISAFIALLEYLRSGIQFKGLPSAVLLAQAAEQPRFADLELQNCETFAEIAPPTALGTALVEESRQALAELAAAPRQRACALLSYLIVQCHAVQEQARQAARQAANLYPRIGVCAGLIAVLLLL